jgi:transposase
MKPEIENLKAQMRGVKLDFYQKGLALDEFYKLIDYVTELEKLSQPLVSSSVCPTCNAKGYRTTLTNNSYACKKCGTWWAN